jgi:hypothetical protein
MANKNRIRVKHYITPIWVALVLQTPATFASSTEANPALVESGKKLVAEAKCETCHIAKVGGDGSAMYTRKDRSVMSKSKLLTQVGRCNNTLNLGLFPDDEVAIAAYLDATHYQLKN